MQLSTEMVLDHSLMISTMIESNMISILRMLRLHV